LGLLAFAKGNLDDAVRYTLYDQTRCQNSDALIVLAQTLKILRLQRL